MATIVIGDVHGNLSALEDLIDRVRPLLGADDTMVFLGDFIDRGFDSKGCVDRILRLRREVDVPVVTLLGNHEQWLLRTFRDATRHSWILGMDGLKTVESYAPEAAREIRDEIARLGPRLLTERVELPYAAFFASMPDEHRDFFRSLPPLFRAEGVVCSHGGVDASLGGVEDQTVDALVWGGEGFPEDYSWDETVVYGHRNDFLLDDRGWPGPRVTGRAIGIDTISTGVLTAVRIPGGEVIQSARHGR